MAKHSEHMFTSAGLSSPFAIHSQFAQRMPAKATALHHAVAVVGVLGRPVQDRMNLVGRQDKAKDVDWPGYSSPIMRPNIST